MEFDLNSNNDKIEDIVAQNIIEEVIMAEEQLSGTQQHLNTLNIDSNQEINNGNGLDIVDLPLFDSHQLSNEIIDDQIDSSNTLTQEIVANVNENENMQTNDDTQQNINVIQSDDDGGDNTIVLQDEMKEEGNQILNPVRNINNYINNGNINNQQIEIKENGE